MLSEAVIGLAERALEVTVVARGERALDDVVRRAATRAKTPVHAVSADYVDARDFLAALDRAVAARGPLALAVAWVHSTAPAIPFEIARRMDAAGAPSRFLHVLGSAVADPSRDDDGRRERFARLRHVSYEEVVLGFVVTRAGSRWLRDEEICAGVLDAVDHPATRTVVGTVTPWSARP